MTLSLRRQPSDCESWWRDISTDSTRTELFLFGAAIASGGYAVMRQSRLGLTGCIASVLLLYASRKSKCLRSTNWSNLRKERIGRKITLNAPLSDVFTMVRMLENWPAIFPSIKQAELSDSHNAAMVIQWSYFKVKLDCAIVQEIPDKLIKFVLKRNHLQYAECTFRFRSDRVSGLDRTIVELACDVPVFIAFRKVEKLLLKPSMTYEIDTCLQRIKQLSECGEIARAQ